MSDDGIARFKDFTKSADAPSFKIEDVLFSCRKGIPIRRLGALSKLAENFNIDGIEDKMISIFEGILTKESQEIFVRCMTTDEPIEIDIDFVREVIPWILEQYGLRPTQASSGSSDTLSESGASLTDGAQPTTSTSPSSNPVEPSTSRNIGSRGTRTKKATPK